METILLAGGRGDQSTETGECGPVVDDSRCEVVCYSGVGLQGFQDGEETTDFVGLEELG